MNTHKKKIHSLTVVIPAYNEEDNIKSTIDEISQIISTISDINNFQVIVVDDHSSDNTFDIVSQMNDSRISCLKLSRRSGSFTAIRAGFNEAKSNVAMCISADGQDNPSCVKHMLEKCRNGANVVWACRKNRDNEAFHIRVMAQLFYRLLKLLGGNKNTTIDLPRADFCLLDKVVIDAINACSEKNTSLFGLIAWLGFNQDFVEYERRDRRSGKSKWNLRSRFNYAKDWIVVFSGIPLRIASLVGFSTAILGVLYAIFIVINKSFLGYPMRAGLASMICLILVLGGTQLALLGTIGEYLWRNIDETRKRPLYFIEKRTLKNKD